MRISDSEQHVLSKLVDTGIDPFKTGMYFLMKKLKERQLLIVAIVDINGIQSITEADKYDIAEAPEYSPVKIEFPGPEYIVKLPRYDLHINIEKR